MLHEARLLLRVAQMAERGADVKRAARLAFVEHVLAAQVFARGLAAGAQLFQMPVAELALRVLFVANCAPAV